MSGLASSVSMNCQKSVTAGILVVMKSVLQQTAEIIVLYL